MKQLHFSGLQDYLALIIRRKWWIIVPFVGLAGVVILLTYALPKMFVSETLILIRPRDVPEEFVKDLLAGTTEQRLTSIEQTVMSRTNMVQILREFEDELPEYRSLNMDQRVLKLSSQIHINFQTEKRMGVDLPITYFRISYQNRSPELAQKIAAKLTSLFVEQDNRARESQVFGTTEFLSAEVEKVAEEMKKSNTSLKELRARRLYELPDQLEPNLRTLDRLGLQKQSNAEAWDRYATIRLNIERLLSETPPTIPRPVPASGAAAVKNALVEEYRKKQRELNELTATFTPKHPDVETARLRLEGLKQELSAEDLTALEQPAGEEGTKETVAQPATTVPNPIYQNLTSQLQEVKTELDLRERERKFLDSEIEKYNQRIQKAPQSEQDIAEVLRQNTDLNKQYETLKNNLAEAKLSESLESRQRGSQFIIVDPANYPLIATKPAKANIAVVGTLLSLLAGIGIAVAVDVFSQRVWTPSEIENVFGVVVLAEIPPIVTHTDLATARRKKVLVGVSSAMGAAAYCVALYFVYLKQNFVLTTLDPLIQRFMQ